MSQIRRITYMEEILNEAQGAAQQLMDALGRYHAVKRRLDELEAYYTSGQWMKDHEDDCEGKLPADLKRGVLSEDAVYNLLEMKSELEMMLKDGL